MPYVAVEPGAIKKKQAVIDEAKFTGTSTTVQIAKAPTSPTPFDPKKAVSDNVQQPVVTSPTTVRLASSVQAPTPSQQQQIDETTFTQNYNAQKAYLNSLEGQRFQELRSQSVTYTVGGKTFTNYSEALDYAKASGPTTLAYIDETGDTVTVEFKNPNEAQRYVEALQEDQIKQNVKALGIPGPGRGPAPGSIAEPVSKYLTGAFQAYEESWENVANQIRAFSNASFGEASKAKLEGDNLGAFVAVTKAGSARIGAGVYEGLSFIARPTQWAQLASLPFSVASDPNKYVKALQDDPAGIALEVIGGLGGGFIAGKALNTAKNIGGNLKKIIDAPDVTSPSFKSGLELPYKYKPSDYINPEAGMGLSPDEFALIKTENLQIPRYKTGVPLRGKYTSMYSGGIPMMELDYAIYELVKKATNQLDTPSFKALARQLTASPSTGIAVVGQTGSAMINPSVLATAGALSTMDFDAVLQSTEPKSITRDAEVIENLSKSRVIPLESVYQTVGPTLDSPTKQADEQTVTTLQIPMQTSIMDARLDQGTESTTEQITDEITDQITDQTTDTITNETTDTITDPDPSPGSKPKPDGGKDKSKPMRDKDKDVYDDDEELREKDKTRKREYYVKFRYMKKSETIRVTAKNFIDAVVKGLEARTKSLIPVETVVTVVK